MYLLLLTCLDVNRNLSPFLPLDDDKICIDKIDGFNIKQNTYLYDIDSPKSKYSYN